MSREDSLELCEMEEKFEFSSVAGIHSHIGSQIIDKKTFVRQINDLLGFVFLLCRMKATEITEINIGVGVGVSYQKDERCLTFSEYAKATAGIVRRRYKEVNLPLPRLVFEPGRAIVADSSILLTIVNYLKKMQNRNWIMVDAGMNDFIRPAMYGSRHEIIMACKNISNETLGLAKMHKRKVVYNVGGPIYESSDVFGQFRSDGEIVTRGDLLAVLDVGAYGLDYLYFYMSSRLQELVSNYMSSPLKLRKRQSPKELFMKDFIPES